MWQANPMALAVVGHGAYRPASASATAIASTGIIGSASEVFDGISTGANGFVSNETSASCIGVSYCGQDFVRPVEIRRVDIWQGYNSSLSGAISSHKVQYSLDASTWVDHTTIALDPATLVRQVFLIPRLLKARAWRVLCNESPGVGNRWSMTEMTFHIMT